MLNAINNIYSINKLVEQSSDDQIIRATNAKLKTDDSIKTYFYVRKNKIDQVLQKLTDWTDGAKTKQALAKNQIISNLKIRGFKYEVQHGLKIHETLDAGF